ncbi:DNA-binding protein c1d [Balamuthia mandrillaris]
MADEIPLEVYSTVEALEQTVQTLQELVGSFLRATQEDVHAGLSEVERAKLHVMLSYTLNSLYYVYLKTQGVSPQGHPVKAELDRVKSYIQKVKRLASGLTVDQSTNEEDKPNLRLNQEAAERFIRHSLRAPSSTEKARPSYQNEQGDQPQSGASTKRKALAKNNSSKKAGKGRSASPSLAPTTAAVSKSNHPQQPSHNHNHSHKGHKESRSPKKKQRT